MKKIKTVKNISILVDNEDYGWINSIGRWNITNGYCRYRLKVRTARGGHKRFSVAMHRLILGIFDPLVSIDHVNRNTLDNRKKNLRICTQAQNSFNCPKRKTNKSGFKGVFWAKKKAKWCVQISYNKIRTTIGMFDNKLEAARAYNEAALKYHGEFAHLNILEGAEK